MNAPFGPSLGPSAPEGALCNRTACRKPGATWWNTSTRAYYCFNCRARIAEANVTHAGAAGLFLPTDQTPALEIAIVLAEATLRLGLVERYAAELDRLAERSAGLGAIRFEYRARDLRTILAGKAPQPIAHALLAETAPAPAAAPHERPCHDPQCSDVEVENTLRAQADADDEAARKAAGGWTPDTLAEAAAHGYSVPADAASSAPEPQGQGDLRLTWGPGNCFHCHRGAPHSESAHRTAIANADDAEEPEQGVGWGLQLRTTPLDAAPLVCNGCGQETHAVLAVGGALVCSSCLAAGQRETLAAIAKMVSAASSPRSTEEMEHPSGARLAEATLDSKLAAWWAALDPKPARVRRQDVRRFEQSRHIRSIFMSLERLGFVRQRERDEVYYVPPGAAK